MAKALATGVCLFYYHYSSQRGHPHDASNSNTEHYQHQGPTTAQADYAISQAQVPGMHVEPEPMADHPVYQSVSYESYNCE
jgi:hypothetical protein